MTEAEQARVTAWRLKILRYSQESRDKSHGRAGILASHGRRSTAGSGGSTRTARQAWPTARIAWITRSSTSCSIGTASPTTSICSIRSCLSGKITTITIVRTGHLTGRLRSNDLSQKLELMCHRGHEILHLAPACLVNAQILAGFQPELRIARPLKLEASERFRLWC